MRLPLELSGARLAPLRALSDCVQWMCTVNPQCGTGKLCRLLPGASFPVPAPAGAAVSAAPCHPCRSAMSYHLPTNPGLPILHHAVTRPVPSSFGLGRSPSQGGGPFPGPHPRDAWISEQPSRIGANRARCAGLPEPRSGIGRGEFQTFLVQSDGPYAVNVGAGRRGSRSADLYIQRGRRGLTARARSIFSRSLPALQASYSGL